MLVSAIIPTYNRATDIVVAIESVLEQTHKDIEILVCDDGSKDNTAEVISTKFGERVRYLAKPNGGVSSARNWGIERAKGDVIAFLDSDDEWLPEKIAAQVEILETRPEIDLVLCGFVEVDAQRNLTGILVNRRNDYPHDGHILPFVVRRPALCPSTCMVRTSVARAVGGFDQNLRTAEDLDFHLKVARRSQIAVIERPMIKYMRAEGSLGSEMRTYRDYVFVLERFLTDYGHELSKEDLREAFLRTYIKNARGLAYNGDVRTAAQLSLKSLPLLRTVSEIAELAKIGAMMGRHLAQQAVKRVTNR
ncbi:MAG: glycosyltransferase [Deltaproteobacteria bacterium]|nr:glycosyltransferase [Deltaproteobacteria bacterium]